jgi:hypothetical protein
MIKVDVKGINQTLAHLAGMGKQVRYAASRALNSAAFAAMREGRKQIEGALDKPTRWTLNSLRQYGRATRVKLETTVDFRGNRGAGILPEVYMRPNIEGGDRRLKRFERALVAVGAMPADHFAVPGEAARLDAHGNITPGQIVQLLSYFRAFPEDGYKANMDDKGRARLAKDNKRTGARGFVYFSGRPGPRGPLGIWQRIQFGFGTSLKPVLIFVPSTNYEQGRFDYKAAAERSIERHLNPTYGQAWTEAMATAR